MAITIIGASRPSKDDPQEASPLPPIDQDLPPPGTAPALARPLGDDLIEKLLAHETPLIRSYAIEQASVLDGDRWSEAITKLVADPDEMVASDAIHALDARKWAPAADAILERYKTATGEVASVAASALGSLAPEKLLEAVKQKGRLDDETYAATATALAIIGSPEVIGFLDKALNRQGALAPERRGSLQGAALLSGSPEVSHRVLSQAIEDSKKEEPDGASYPSRGALAAIAGLPLPFSRRAAGLELFDSARAEIEATVLPHLGDTEKAKLEEALKTKRPAAVLAALEPILALPEQPEEKKEAGGFGNMPRRRRGLLRAMIDRKDAIDTLEVAGGAVFVAAAVQAATVILAGEGSAAGSPAIATLVKALEDATLDAVKLATMSEDELTALFQAKTERQMRRVHGILTHESFRQPAVLRRFMRAIVRAGHAEGLFEAAGDVNEPLVHDAALKALKDTPELAEKLVVEALTKTPLEPKLARLGLMGAEELRTQRIALALGRRFSELRALSRGRFVRAALRLGDARLVSLLEARAFVDEPEEVAWTILSLVHGKEMTERLAGAVERSDPHRAREAEKPLQLPLRCTRCKETLAYGFERVFLDIESKDKYGDPAYVGDTSCKACGADDVLEPTEEAGRILTTYMLKLLQESRRGALSAPPLVSPAQTVVSGKKLGLAGALRQLDKDVKESPQSIRTRLHRARVKATLKRRNVSEDLEAALAVDPRAAEAIALQGTTLVREGRRQEGADKTAEAIRLLRGNPPARLYDTPDAASFAGSLEDYLVDLERAYGVKLPDDLDLTLARARMTAREKAMAEAQAAEEKAIAEAEEARLAGGRREEDEPGELTERQLAMMAHAGRNVPCPCGSGKKFKKCHGRGK